MNLMRLLNQMYPIDLRYQKHLIYQSYLKNQMKLNYLNYLMILKLQMKQMNLNDLRFLMNLMNLKNQMNEIDLINQLYLKYQMKLKSHLIH
jgi:hypothetical protein